MFCNTISYYYICIYNLKTKIMKDEIFNAYLEDRCPLCDSDNLSLVSENIGAGKTLSSTFFCISCKSDYVVGFNRSFNPIQSEILTDNYNKKTTILNKKKQRL